MEIKGKQVHWGHELMLTWSKYASLLSSKKIIQNSSYSFGTITLLTYHFGKLLCWVHCEGYSPAEAIGVATCFFSVGGYATHKILQEKKADVQDNPPPIAPLQ